MKFIKVSCELVFSDQYGWLYDDSAVDIGFGTFVARDKSCAWIVDTIFDNNYIT